MFQEKAPKPNSEREALLKAVENTDISFFSPMFDMQYKRLVSRPHPGKVIEKIYEEALGEIINDPTIKRVGLEKILQSYENKESAVINFSELTRRALDYFISNPHFIDSLSKEK